MHDLNLKRHWGNIVPITACLLGSYNKNRILYGKLLCYKMLYNHTNAHSVVQSAQYRRTLITLLVSRCNDHDDPVIDCVGLVGFKSKAVAF